MLLSALSKKYNQQTYDAARRGIGFHLTFEEWLSLWQASGQLKNRGCCKGQYVMARFKDEGDYRIGNVEIILCEQNHSDASSKMRGIKKTQEHKNKLRQARLGTKATAATKAKMSAKRKGIPLGPMRAETKAKLSAAHKGKPSPPKTVEGRKRLSEAKKEYWRARKAQLCF